MYKVTLRKIRSTHNNLRTNEVDGVIEKLPEVGESVVLVGEGIEFGSRLVYTTPIIEFQSRTPTYMEFKTANSLYALEVHGEV